MDKKIFYIFVFLLAMSLVSAASYDGTLSVNTGSGSVVINSGGCQEDWSSSVWSSCTGDNQTFICFDKNSCGTYSLMPAQCGTVQDCNVQTSSSSGGGSSGGGSSNKIITTSTSSSNSDSCVESWQCGNWSNSNEQCGIRSCIDSNKCGTTSLKPVISKECQSTSLFDITGGVIGGISDFVKTSEGTVTFIGLIMIIVLSITLFSVRKKKINNN